MPTAILNDFAPMHDGNAFTWPSGMVSLWLDFDKIGRNPAFPGNGTIWVFDQTCLYGWEVNPGFTISNTHALPGKMWSGSNTVTAGTNQNGCWLNGTTDPNQSVNFNGISTNWQLMSYGTNFGNRPFCIEFWAYLTSNPAGGTAYYLVGQNDSTTPLSWQTYIDSSGFFNFTFNTGTQITATSTGAVPLNQWNHYAVQRLDDTIYTFVNGTLVASVGVGAGGAYMVDGTTNPLLQILASVNDRAAARTPGWIDQVLITQGAARFDPAGFTPSINPNPIVFLTYGQNTTPIGALPFLNAVTGLVWNTIYITPADFTIVNNNIGSFAQFHSIGTTMATVTAGAGVQRESLKHYFEVAVTGSATGSATGIGILDTVHGVHTSWVGQDAHGIGFYWGTSNTWYNQATSTPLTLTGLGTAGDVIGVAVFWDTATSQTKLWIRRNGGAWAGGGDPATNTTPSVTLSTTNLTTGIFKVACHRSYTAGTTYNFQVLQGPAFTIPSGFTYWV